MSDLDARVVVVGHWDWLAGSGVEQLEARRCAQGRRFLVADPGETTDVLVRAVFEVFTGMWAVLCACRGARDRVMRVLTAAQREPSRAA